jgi:hypothetical protein
LWIWPQITQITQIKKIYIGLLLADGLVNIYALEMCFSWIENASCSPVTVTGRRTSHDSKPFIISCTWIRFAGHADLSTWRCTACETTREPPEKSQIRRQCAGKHIRLRRYPRRLLVLHPVDAGIHKQLKTL